MDRYKLLNALDNPSYIDKIDYEQLEGIIETYPYFQTGYLLLAQKIAQNTHVLPASQLSAIATHIGSREVLYKMLHPTDVQFMEQTLSQDVLNQLQQEAKSDQLPLLEDIAEETITQGEDIAPSQLHQIADDQTPPTADDTNETTTTDSQPKAAAHMPAIVLENTSEIAPPILLDSIEEDDDPADMELKNILQKTDEKLAQILQNNTPPDNNTPALNDDSLLSTGEINEQARLQVEQELTKRLQNKTTDDTPPLSTDTSDMSAIIQQEVRQLIQQKVEKDLEKIHAAEKTIEEREMELIQESIEDHDNLIKQLQNKITAYKGDFNPEALAELEKETPANDLKLEDHSIDANTDLMSDLKAKLDAFKATNQDDNSLVIDQSESSTSIDELLSDFEAYKQQKTKFSLPTTDNTPTNDQQQSNLNNEPPTPNNDQQHLKVSREGMGLSEMMAKVYARQGAFDKAIQIYQQLNLEFPEKSAYFAAQIQELQNKK